MNIITSILSLLWILLVGTPQPKNSLHKKPTKEDAYRNLECWIYRNFNYLICIAFIFLLLLCGLAMFWLAGVSAVESGTYYNKLGGVI